MTPANVRSTIEIHLERRSRDTSGGAPSGGAAALM